MRRLLTLGLAVIALAACAPKPAQRPACPAGKTCILIGNVSDMNGLDPNKSTGTWEHLVLSDAIMGLTQDSADGTPVPGMATSWDVSTDGLTWTFHLRDAVWSDGVPVTADDFVFSLRRELNPATAAELASLIYFIKNAQAVGEGKLPATELGVRAVDPHTLEIRLEHPAPYLPELAAHTSMLPVPRHMVETYGDDWARPEHYVSNGAFRIAEWKLGDHVKSVKNLRFYEADKVCVDEVTYYPTNDAISAERRVKRGELDINRDIQSNRIAFLRTAMPGYPRTHSYLGVVYLSFNSHVKAFQDVRVRRALAMSVDREFITRKLLRGGQQPAYTFVPPGVANSEPAAKPYWAALTFEQRQAEARRLLAEAGYGPDNPLKFEMKHRNSADPMLFMPAIQADWKQIGVEGKLVQNEVQIAYAAYRSRDFDVAEAGWVADYNDPMTFLYLLQSNTGAQTYGDYSNPAFDGLVTAADHEPDVSKRAHLLAQAEKLVLDGAAVVPVFVYVNKNLVSPRVTGWVANISDRHPTRYLCVKGAAAKP